MNQLADDTKAGRRYHLPTGGTLRDALRPHEGRAAVRALHKRDDSWPITYSTGAAKHFHFGDGDAAGIHGSHFGQEEST